MLSKVLIGDVGQASWPVLWHFHNVFSSLCNLPHYGAVISTGSDCLLSFPDRSTAETV